MSGSPQMIAFLTPKEITWGGSTRGGIAHTFHVFVATLTKGDAKPKVVWRAVGGPLKDYAAFLDALRSGTLDDRLDYAH